MADFIVENVLIIDVITEQEYLGWFSVKDGRFIEVEAGHAPSRDELPAQERIDAQGLVARPGLIDAHMHIESSLVTPARFAEAVLPWGTTTILQDPHEVANVLGAEGIRWMIHASQNLPLRIYAAISSCVPATSSDIETPNASIRPEDVLELAKEEGVLALGEMMDYQGLLDGNTHLQAMLTAGRRAHLSLEGHIPSLTGRPLSRYIAHGIRSDHTLMTPAKLHEKLRKGLYVMLQEKSLTPDVIAAVTTLPDRSRILLISDDVMPNRLRTGHMSRILETAVSLGWNPIDALASATLRPAVYLGLRHLGAIAPGYWADFMLSTKDQVFPPEQVYVNGKLVAEKGSPTITASPELAAHDLSKTSFVAKTVPEDFFRLSHGSPSSKIRARVIKVNNENTFTTLEERSISLVDGVPTDEDLALGVVIARATLQKPVQASGKMVLVSGLGLRQGAYASTFAHDSHNVFVLGKSLATMRHALEAVLSVDGGMAVVSDEESEPILLPLPVAGLLSNEPIAFVGERFDAMEEQLRQLGVGVKNPILLFTILPLTVSPEYKISDKGLVDVERRRIIEAVVSA